MSTVSTRKAMGTIQHTPGPWTAARHTGKPDKRLGLGWCVNGPKSQEPMELSERVADCYGSRRASANARLIAAAPDLLEALHVAARDLEDASLRFADEGNRRYFKQAAEVARAAIAKATGAPL